MKEENEVLKRDGERKKMRGWMMYQKRCAMQGE